MAIPMIQFRMGARLGNQGRIAQWRLLATGAGLPDVTVDDLEDMANDVAAALDGVKDYFTPDVLGLSVAAQLMTTVPHVPTTKDPSLFHLQAVSVNVGNTTPVIGNGTGGGDILPPQCSPVVTLRSGLAGRRRRGRVYLWPIAENFVDEAGAITTWNGTEVVQPILDAIEAFAGEGSPLTPVIWSGMDDDIAVITSIDMGPRIDTQRRRLPRNIR